MSKFSSTIAGILIMVGGQIFMEYSPFTEGCSTEIVAFAPTLLGAVIAWLGRYRAGGITILGVRK